MEMIKTKDLANSKSLFEFLKIQEFFEMWEHDNNSVMVLVDISTNEPIYAGKADDLTMKYGKYYIKDFDYDERNSIPIFYIVDGNDDIVKREV